MCHLGKFYPPASGGIESHLQTLARAQAELGLSVQVLCVNHMDDEGRDVTWKNFAATPTRNENDGSVRVTRLGRRASIARLDICPGLVGALRGLNPDNVDIIHLHVPNPTMILALYACRPRVPWVIGYHSDVVKQKALLLLQRPFENWVFREARAVFAASPEYPKASAYLQRFADKTKIIPYGIDLGPFQDPGEDSLRYAEGLRREHGEPLWLAVGRLVYYKGLHNAIRALTLVRGKLLIVGSGPLKGSLETLAGELGVASRVVWLGNLKAAELQGAYRAATALWFPSNARSEAFGLVQVEAMASGCPVINCSIPGSGVSWVSPHEESGLTVGVDDWQDLAAAANRLLNDRELSDRLRHHGRDRARRQFSAPRMAEMTFEIYREVR
ncbi:MAG: glycosyltransferase [Planctomycetota bacterium]